MIPPERMGSSICYHKSVISVPNSPYWRKFMLSNGYVLGRPLWIKLPFGQILTEIDFEL